MSGHCCCLLVALAYLQGIEGGVVRPLPHPDAQKLPVVPQENGLSGKEQHGPPAGSYLATERPSHNLTVEPFQYPEYPEEDNYFEREMTPEEESSYKKSLGVKTATLWPEGILYYDFSDEFLVEEKRIIEWAIFELQQETCLRFLRRTTEPTYIVLRKADLGCSSKIGYNPLGQRIDFYLSSPECLTRSIIQHELVHTLGLWHKHSQPHRNAFVKEFWNKSLYAMDPNFVAWPSVEPYDWLHYDYKLVMYHLSHGFSKDLYGAANLPTDIKTLFTIGQRIFFNSLDIDKLNILYNCDLSEILKIKDAHSLALKSEKNVTQVLFPNTTSEKAMFSKPETGVDTSSTTQDDNSFSKSVVENNTILAQPV